MTRIKVKKGNTWQDIGLEYYPVNSVYISFSSTSPATLFGGTWVQITSGVLRMANNTNTGGSDTFTISADNLPKHQHKIPEHDHEFKHNHGYYKPNSSTEGTTLTAGQLAKHTHGEKSLVGQVRMGDNYLLNTYDANFVGNASGIISIYNTNNYVGKATGDTGENRNRPRGIKVDATHTHNEVGNNEAHSHTIKTTSDTTYSQNGTRTAKKEEFSTTDGDFSNTAISNLPAYQNLYAWRRTA